MLRNTIIFFVALIVVCYSTTVSAGKDVPNRESPGWKDPSGKSEIQVDQSITLRFLASRESKRVSATVGTDLWNQNVALNFSIEGPIEDSDDQKILNNFESLNSGTAASFGISYVFWPNQRPSPQDQMIIVKEYMTIRFGKWKEEISFSEEDQFVEHVGISQSVADSLKYLFLKANSVEERKTILEQYSQTRFGENLPKFKNACAKALETNPTPEALNEIAKLLIPGGEITKDQAKTFRERFVKPSYLGNVFLLSILGKTNMNLFEYYDPSTLDKSEDRLSGRSLSLGLAILTKANNFIGAGVKVAKSYKGAPKRQICIPREEGGFECRILSLAPPTASDSAIFFLEHRKFFNSSFGFSPRLYANMTNGGKGLEIPLFFLADKNSHLIGGITSGYNTENEEFSLGFFIGKELNFTNSP